MNPLLKKQIHTSLFFLFVAAFGALLFLMMTKRHIESEISNFYFLADKGTISYFTFNLVTSFGSIFGPSVLIFLISALIYSIYSFYEEKNATFVAFIPVKKTSAYFYKWISGVLFIAVAFVIVFVVAAVLIIYFKPSIDDIYGKYNGIIESYGRQSEFHFSFANSAADIFLYLIFLFCIVVLAFSFILFAISAFGKITHAVAFIFSIVIFGFALIFITANFAINFQNDMGNTIMFVSRKIMSFYSAIDSMFSLRVSTPYISIDTFTNISSNLSVNYFIGIVVCCIGAALFYIIGRNIYAGSEISRNDKFVMTDSLKKPILIYFCIFCTFFLYFLALIANDILS